MQSEERWRKLSDLVVGQIQELQASKYTDTGRHCQNAVIGESEAGKTSEMSQTKQLLESSQIIMLQIKCPQVGQSQQSSGQTLKLTVLKPQFCQVHQPLQAREDQQPGALIVDLQPHQAACHLTQLSREPL